MKVAINGFGRIGRSVLKIALNKGVDIVAVNDLNTPEQLAYILKYDSVYGPYHRSVSFDKDHIIIDKKKILVLAEPDPTKLPWKKLGIDVVLEATGRFTDRDGASKHLEAGAKKVLISAPAKNPDVTIVLGVNDKILKREHQIISMASCTTNCIAPIVKILNDEFGVETGYLTTIHAYTQDQQLLDTPHKKFRRGRSAAINLVPTTSGAATATAEVIPELEGRLDGMAIRAPVPCGSISDFVAVLKKNVTASQVNKAIENASKKIPTVLEYSQEELVSTDVIGNPHSSIFDSKLTRTNGKQVKVFSWYDNEYGYSNRIVDLLKKLK